MRKVLFITHGEMAKGALNTLKIFTNEVENITAICAFTDECPDHLAAVEKFFEDAGDAQVFAFSDIVFGSVNQALIPYLNRPNTYVFTGFNLPMLLQMTSLPEDASIEEIRNLEAEGKGAVVFMNDYDFGGGDDSEDE